MMSPDVTEYRFDERGFLAKLKRFAYRLGRPAVGRLYALFFMMKSPDTPMRAKLLIAGALAYFLSPVDSIPDLLMPFGFSDDLTVLALVYEQMRQYLNEDIRSRAAEAAEKLFPKG